MSKTIGLTKKMLAGRKADKKAAEAKPAKEADKKAAEAK